MIIHETRWKCDYCGCVSPVVEEGEKPSGWVKWQSVRDSKIYAMLEEWHFCCPAHSHAWADEKTGIRLLGNKP